MSNARMFGAVGDGQADDTAALQHAIDDGNGVLELAKGDYRITRPLVFDLTQRGYLGIRGDQGTARLIMAGEGPALKFVGDHRGTAQPASVQPHTYDNERMPIVSGLEILGAHDNADGVQLLRTLQATIQNTLIRRCRHGVHLVERNRNVLLSAAHIFDCHDTGVFFDACNLHQVIVTGCHISYCKRAGIRQFDGDVHNIQITGNDIEYNSGAEGTTGEIVLEAPAGIISEYTIASNTIQATREARGANILILGRAEDPAASVRLVAISGNVIGSRTRNIDIRHGSRIAVSGNTIYDGTELNVSLEKSIHIALSGNTILTRPTNWDSQSVDGVLLADCTGCSLTGNLLSDSALGNEQQGGAITLLRCVDTSVSSCQVLNPQIRGIDAIDCRRLRIADNSVSESRDTPRMLSAIRIGGASRQVVVQNNCVTLGVANSIELDPACGQESGNTVWS